MCGDMSLRISLPVRCMNAILGKSVESKSSATCVKDLGNIDITWGSCESEMGGGIAHQLENRST